MLLILFLVNNVKSSGTETFLEFRDTDETLWSVDQDLTPKLENQSKIFKFVDSDKKTKNSPIVINQLPGIIIENTTFNTAIIIKNSPDSIIRNNVIQNVLSSNEPYGIQIIESPNSIIENNQILNLTSHGDESGNIHYSAVSISVRFSARTKVIDNTIQNTTSDLDSIGIHIYYSDNCEISGNSINNLKAELEGKGIYIGNSHNARIINNSIYNITPGNSYISVGIDLRNGPNSSILNNSIDNIQSKLGFGINVVESDNVIIRYNSILNTKYWITREIRGNNIVCNDNLVNGQLIDGCNVPGLTKLLDYNLQFSQIFMIALVLLHIRKHKQSRM
jgi:parallel beta-helix repeat protein